MKKILYFIFLTFCSLQLHAGEHDSLINRLNNLIRNKQHYISIKEKRISSYKKLLVAGIDREKEYEVNEKLYKEYRKFRIDSAQYFTNRNIEIAELLKNAGLGYKAKIQLANLYSSRGDFLESQSILKSINSKLLSRDLKALYYEFYSQFYEHYSTNNPHEFFRQRIEIYRDSLLAILNQNSNKYKINLAQHYIYEKKLEAAKNLLSGLAEKSQQRDPDYAMFVYLLGDICMIQKDNQNGLKNYTLAAITDVENAIKDHGAIQNLAVTYYYSGKIDLAYKYAQSAIEDAVFCNVKFRTLMMSEFYSIINAAYQEKESKSRNELERYLILISVLTVFLVLAILYVYRQMKRVSKIKEALSLSTTQLELLNRNMIDANQQLHESNRVKEEYIAQFFDICSSYIVKLEDYRKKLNIKAINKQFDELAKMLKSTDFTQNELQELYKNFDVVFLNLYPTYVEEFNALLIPEEQIALKEGELLNMELRIFALERLGIADSVKIASFLRFSLSTIYNYRTKIRNKAAVTRDIFEAQIEKIGSKVAEDK